MFLSHDVSAYVQVRDPSLYFLQTGHFGGHVQDSGTHVNRPFIFRTEKRQLWETPDRVIVPLVRHMRIRPGP